MLTLTESDCTARAQRDALRAEAAEARGDQQMAAKLWQASRVWREAAVNARAKRLGKGASALGGSL